MKYVTLTLTAALFACGTTPPTQNVICTKFRVGADFSKTDFGVTGDPAVTYNALAQAAGDVSLAAASLMADVKAACEEMAFQLGASPNDARIHEKLDAEYTREVCLMAAEGIKQVNHKLAEANVVIHVSDVRCAIDGSFQIECERQCKDDPSCTEASEVERCDANDRVGECSGTCGGTCLGMDQAAVNCLGSCDGACFGTCGATDGTDGACGPSGCVCDRECTGSCTGACQPSAPMACSGRCRGECSVALVDAACTGALAAPRCQGNVDCQNSCAASAAARSDCRDGSLSVILDPASQGDAEVQRIAHLLDRNLPVVFLAARGRAKALSDHASSLTDAAGHLLAYGDSLGQEGSACGILIGKTGTEASTNLKAALEGSKAVADAVN